MSEILPFVAGAWPAEARVDVDVFSDRLNALHRMEDDLKDVVARNGRQPYEGWFYSRPVQPPVDTTNMRESIRREREWLIRERARLQALGTGIRP